MAASPAGDYKIYLSNDGTSGGAKQELEQQGAITFNLGRSTQREQLKGQVLSYQTNEGETITFDVIPESPRGTVQALLWAASQANTNVYAWFEGGATGDDSIHGLFSVAISQIDSPVEGFNTWSVELGAVGALAFEAVV